jgi:hypothetical protein
MGRLETLPRGNAVPELDAPASQPPATAPSRKLRIVALTLLILPLLLPIPFDFLQAWLIEPTVREQRRLYYTVLSTAHL